MYTCIMYTCAHTLTLTLTLTHLHLLPNSTPLLGVTQLVSSLPVNGTLCPSESGLANRTDVPNCKYSHVYRCYTVIKNMYNVRRTEHTHGNAAQLPMHDYNVIIFHFTIIDDLLFISSAYENLTSPVSHSANIALYITACVFIISVIIRIIVELVQLVKRHYRYFLTVENYIELGAYSSSIIFVIQFGHNCWCSTNWQWQLGSVSVFLAWINLILFLKRVPLLGIYVLMFNSILYTFLKFALIAFLFVVAFCIAFYMILYKAVSVLAWQSACVHLSKHMHSPNIALPSLCINNSIFV